MVKTYDASKVNPNISIEFGEDDLKDPKTRQDILDEIRRKRAAAARSEGIIKAAEEGQYGDVGQGNPKGEFDDEINQDSKPSFFEMLKSIYTDPRTSMFGAGVDLFGRVGASMSPVAQKPLEKISEEGDTILDKAGQFFYEDMAKATKKINEGAKFDDLTFSEKFALASLPAEFFPGLGLAPDVLRAIKNFAVNTGKLAKEGIESLIQPSAVTDTGVVLNIKPEDLKGIITPGGKGTTAGKMVDINLSDENIINILEKARKGEFSKEQAALQIQKLFPGSGLIKSDKTASAGFITTPKFRDIFKEYVFNVKADDIFEAKVINNVGAAVTRKVKNNILKAKEIADKDLSDVSYAIKFRNALSNFYPVRKKDTYSRVDEAFYDSHDSGTIANAKAIFEYLGLEPSVLNMPVSINKGSGFKLWNKIKINSDDPIKGEVLSYFKKHVIFDDTGKTFSQIKNNLLNNNEFVKSKLSQTKKLFENENANIFDVDHIQPPRFGGTNAESNLQLLPVGEHGSLKALSPEKIMSAQSVKAKTNFEIEFFKESIKMIDLIKNGKTEEAMKLSSELDNMVNNFKNTFKNTNFKVGEPHLPKKTGEKTGEYIKYSDKLNLSTEQKKLVDSLLNKEEYSNLSNVNKTIEQQASEILDMYQQMALISPTGKIPNKPLKIPGDITSMDIPLPAGQVDLRKDVISFKKDGGIVGISHLTRPL